jgi:hypothetical protein
MPVTDVQVATLRALLAHEWDEHQRLVDRLSDYESKRGYSLLLTGAFFEAVEHRFRGKPRSEMIKWVADLRARVDSGDHIDPSIAERLILWVFGKGEIDDLDSKLVQGHQILLTGFLIEERQLDAPELDAFMQQARVFADTADGRSGQ